MKDAIDAGVLSEANDVPCPLDCSPNPRLMALVPLGLFPPERVVDAWRFMLSTLLANLGGISSERAFTTAQSETCVHGELEPHITETGTGQLPICQAAPNGVMCSTVMDVSSTCSEKRMDGFSSYTLTATNYVGAHGHLEHRRA